MSSLLLWVHGSKSFHKSQAFCTSEEHFLLFQKKRNVQYILMGLARVSWRLSSARNETGGFSYGVWAVWKIPLPRCCHFLYLYKILLQFEQVPFTNGISCFFIFIHFLALVWTLSFGPWLKCSNCATTFKMVKWWWWITAVLLTFSSGPFKLQSCKTAGNWKLFSL